LEFFRNKVINQKKIQENSQNDEVKKIKIEKEKELKQIDKESKNDNSFSTALLSKDNYKDKESFDFENEIKDFILNKDCKKLQNLIFLFNLKIPKTTPQI
jgi:hypothetical protein